MIINLDTERLVMGEEVLPITNWFDSDGEECNADDAATAVAGPTSEGKWIALNLAEFGEVVYS